MIKPLVSVILQTYNRGYSLKYTIRSILLQTFRNWELIVVDDSTDNTKAYVQGLKDPRIKYLRNEHRLGSPKARNIGINRSVGQILLMVEDDVWIEEHCLEEVIKTIWAGADVVCFKMKFVKGLSINNEYNPQEFYNLVTNTKYQNSIPYKWHEWLGEMTDGGDPGKYMEVKVCRSVFAVKKSVLDDVGFYDEGYVGNYYREETDIQLRMSRAGYKIVYTPGTFCLHFRFKRRTGGQAMNQMRYEYFTIKNHMRLLRKFHPRMLLARMWIFLLYRYMYHIPKRAFGYTQRWSGEIKAFPIP